MKLKLGVTADVLANSVTFSLSLERLGVKTVTRWVSVYREGVSGEGRKELAGFEGGLLDGRVFWKGFMPPSCWRAVCKEE